MKKWLCTLILLTLRNYPESSAYCRHQSTASSSSPNPRWGWPRRRLCISAPSLAHLILPICVTSVILVLGCSPNTVEEFRREGEAIAISLAKDLQKVETVADLEAIGSKIKKRLNRLTDLMVASQHLVDDKPRQEPYGSQLLRRELQRIYTIEGGQEAFELLCADALVKIQLNLH